MTHLCGTVRKFPRYLKFILLNTDILRIWMILDGKTLKCSQLPCLSTGTPPALSLGRPLLTHPAGKSSSGLQDSAELWGRAFGAFLPQQRDRHPFSTRPFDSQTRIAPYWVFCGRLLQRSSNPASTKSETQNSREMPSHGR